MLQSRITPSNIRRDSTELSERRPPAHKTVKYFNQLHSAAAEAQPKLGHKVRPELCQKQSKALFSGKYFAALPYLGDHKIELIQLQLVLTVHSLAQAPAPSKYTARSHHTHLILAALAPFIWDKNGFNK